MLRKDFNAFMKDIKAHVKDIEGTFVPRFDYDEDSFMVAYIEELECLAATLREKLLNSNL